jgi:hypothetical protein
VGDGAGTVGDDPSAAAAPPEARPRQVLRSRSTRFAAAGVVLALVVGVVVVLARDDGGSARAQLDAARHVFATPMSHHYVLTETLNFPKGYGVDEASRIEYRSDVDVDRGGNERASISASQHGVQAGHTESITIGSNRWVTSGGAPTEAQEPPWTKPWIKLAVAEPRSTNDLLLRHLRDLEDPLDAKHDAFELLPLEVSVALGPRREAIDHLLEVARQADHLSTQDRRGGGSRLVARLAPPSQIMRLAPHGMPDVEITLDLDARHRVSAARIEARVGSAFDRIDLSLSQWGEPIEVKPPSVAEVDDTPWIFEEDLTGVDRSLRLAPTRLPEGYALTGAGVIPDDLLPRPRPLGRGCPSVELTYGTQAFEEGTAAGASPDDEPPGPVAVLVMTSECAATIGDPTTAFDRQVAGHAARERSTGAALGTEGDVLVDLGNLVVELTGPLSKRDLDALVGSLAPFEPGSLGEAVPPWARTRRPFLAPRQTYVAMSDVDPSAPGVADPAESDPRSPP